MLRVKFMGLFLLGAANGEDLLDFETHGRTSRVREAGWSTQKIDDIACDLGRVLEMKGVPGVGIED